MNLAALTLILITAGSWEQTPPAAPAAEPGISDNSFLMEEAYNQDFGVVQHINTSTRFGKGEWAYTFTQEWPLPAQRHQLSYSLPVVEAGGEAGVGDVALNYRYQALDGSSRGLAVAPRLSLLIPTGSSARGLGAGGTGLQVGLPASQTLGARFVAHSNLGATWVPRARNPSGERAAAWGWNAGQSVVWLARPSFNALVELVWARSQEVVGPGRTQASDSLLLSPGIRWAHNFENGLQIVPGVAVPVGLGPSHGDRGLLLYLSFEHPFRRARP